MLCLAMRTFIIFVVLSMCLGCVACHSGSDSWLLIDLLHAIDASQPDYFTPRGYLKVNSMHTGVSSFHQHPLTEHEHKQFMQLAQQSRFYRLMANVTYPDNKQETMLTYTPACGLLETHLNDVLWLAIDRQAHVHGITITAGDIGTGKRECANATITLRSNQFQTELMVRETELAPWVDTASYIQKLQRKQEKAAAGEDDESTGNLAKYFVYLIPVFLMVFITNFSSNNLMSGNH